MTSNKTAKTLLLIFQITAFMVFAGRAWQHLFWDAPYRTFFWDQGWMEGIVTSLSGLTWQEYATSPITDALIQGAIRLSGIFYALCAVLALLIRPESRRWMGRVLLAGSLGLTFLAFLYMKEKYFHTGQFFEYSAQIASPVFLYLFVRRHLSYTTLFRWICLVVAVTFVCHGLYAIGFYPRPGFFVDMVINSLGVSENTAHELLRIAAIMDFIVAGLLIFPQSQRVALWYMVAWGLLTSMARPVAQVGLDFFWTDLHRWFPEFVFRAPHYLLPFAALYILRYKSSSPYQPGVDMQTPARSSVA